MVLLVAVLVRFDSEFIHVHLILQTFFFCYEVNFSTHAWFESWVDWNIVTINQTIHFCKLLELKACVTTLLLWTLEAWLLILLISCNLEAVLKVINCFLGVKKLMTKFIKFAWNFLQLNSRVSLRFVNIGAVFRFRETVNNFLFVWNNSEAVTIMVLCHKSSTVRNSTI